MSLVTNREARDMTSNILAQDFAQAVKAKLRAYHANCPWLPPASILIGDVGQQLKARVSTFALGVEINHLFWVSSVGSWEKFVAQLPTNPTMVRHVVSFKDVLEVANEGHVSGLPEERWALAVVYVEASEGTLWCLTARQLADELLATGLYDEVAISGAPYRLHTDIGGARRFEVQVPTTPNNLPAFNGGTMMPSGSVVTTSPVTGVPRTSAGDSHKWHRHTSGYHLTSDYQVDTNEYKVLMEEATLQLARTVLTPGWFMGRSAG